jgi:hypothetical protein
MDAESGNQHEAPPPPLLQEAPCRPSKKKMTVRFESPIEQENLPCMRSIKKPAKSSDKGKETDNQLEARSRLLATNSTLRQQHSYLVEESRTVTEDEFWITHQNLVKEEQARIEQHDKDCGLPSDSDDSSSESHESAVELSFDKAPAPYQKPHFLDPESSEDDEDDVSKGDDDEDDVSKGDDDEYDASKGDDNIDQQAPSLQTNTEEDATSNPILNLHCNKSIKASYPKNDLQAPFSFRISSEKLDEFMMMPKDQQKAEKRAYSQLTPKEKKKLKTNTPGSSCSCCKPVKRSGKGKLQQAPSEEEAASNSIINLHCNKSIKASYPKNELQAPFSFRTSVEKLDEFMTMPKDQQKAAKSACSQLTQKQKKKLMNDTPGSSCSCCKPVKRSDKGKRRGRNASTKRQSKRLRGDHPSSPQQQGESTSARSPATSTRSPATSAPSYNSLAHGEAARAAAPGEDVPKYKRQSKSKLEYASSVQMQGGETAMKEIMKAQRAMIKALTFSSKAPTFDATSGTFKHDQRKEIPRVRGIMVIVNEVGETPMCGGNIPDGKLRRDKAQITYVSACKEDASYVLDALCEAQNNPNEYEKLKFMGSGVSGLEKFDAYTNNRKLSRSKTGQRAQSIQDSQASIPDNVAPSRVVPD